MNAVKSPWFWLALVALVIGAAILWRRTASGVKSAGAVTNKGVPPKGGTLDSLAQISTAAASIFKTYKESNGDDDDED